VFDPPPADRLNEIVSFPLFSGHLG